ncbi:FAD-dependent monooxygenase [Corynebacterium glucuronolyticum]|uniref:FAD-dependent monooxygenase n=1 Tax=Corynebacterium glucuronolyticum TaxID=39791 RepID=UPI003F6DB354
MQFHHNGYVSKDPKKLPAQGYGLERPDELPDEMDVLIVGSGPAGVIAAAQLSMFPTVRTHIIERREGRLMLGHADGVQSRSVETFQAFQFAKEIVEEAYRITEMSFWNKDPENPENIIRTSRPIDDEFGISEFPHIIINQARVLDYFLRFAAYGPARITPDYGWEFVTLEIDRTAEYPATVTLKNVADGHERQVRAKYVVGCDGASSKVRKSIGRKLEGDLAHQAWGVMDVLVDTDFPDWRTKCAIHSKAGSILHIPREGGFLCRIYVDLGIVTDDDNHKIRETPIEEIVEKANAIYAPYHIDVKNVPWFSVYEVGHRVVDGFDDIDGSDDTYGSDEGGTVTPHVFLTGDACHTHSAKAGQGMNVSIQDGFNIGWKLGHVVSGRAPEELLKTYGAERHPAATNLINFDKKWSTLMATPIEQLEDPEEVEKFYIAGEEFAAGMLTTYEENLLTTDTTYQDLATGFPIGRRFKSHMAMRRCDAHDLHIGHEHVADGRYRIYVFADQAAPTDPNSKVPAWAEAVEDTVRRYTPADADDNAVFDIKVIYQQEHGSFETFDAPDLFYPTMGKFNLTLLDNVWAAIPDDDIFTGRSISRDGAVVIVRPDQYVGAVLPLDRPDLVADYFDGLLLPAN